MLDFLFFRAKFLHRIVLSFQLRCLVSREGEYNFLMHEIILFKELTISPNIRIGQLRPRSRQRQRQRQRQKIPRQRVAHSSCPTLVMVISLDTGQSWGEKRKVATCLFLNPTFTFRHICFQFVFENLKHLPEGKTSIEICFFLPLAFSENLWPLPSV